MPPGPTARVSALSPYDFFRFLCSMQFWFGAPLFRAVLDCRCDVSFVVVYAEFLLHRVVLFVLGLVLMVVPHTLSESVVFYYGGSMTIGIFLVILIILFRGMKLLPIGKKSSLAIFAYSSVVGMTTYFLHYLSGMLRSVLVEIGIAEDMHNPLGIFVLVCVILAGAWFGYWSVRKLVLAEDGSVDEGVAFFVEWSLLIISAVMILQSSLDYLFAFVALVFCVIIKAIARIEGKSKVLRYIFGFLRPLVAVVAKCQLCALDTHEKGRLFAQLVDLLQFYEGFGINNHSGTQLGDDDVLQAHYSRFQAFQLLAFKQEPKLRDFALSSIGSLHKRADLTKKLLVLSDVELQDLVCNKEHIIRWIGCMYPLGLSCLASTSSSPVSEAAI